MDQSQPHGSECEIPRRCTATSKRSGEQCRKPVMRGRTVCLAHGGRTPRGVASPHFRHGRHSRDLPTRVAARYEQAQTDAELVSLRADVALIDVRISEVLGRLDPDGDNVIDGPLWREVRGLIQDRRKLVMSEVKWHVMSGQMISAEQAMVLVAALTDAVKRHITDPVALAAIATDIAQLLDRP